MDISRITVQMEKVVKSKPPEWADKTLFRMMIHKQMKMS